MFTNAYVYGAIFLMQASTFFRREIFDRVGGFNVKNRISWDGEMFINMALAGGKFAVADQFWSAYRVHKGSITGTRSNKERLQRSHAEMFASVMGRPPGMADTAISFGFKLRRKILNPRDTWERILRGPVFGRSSGS